MAHGYVLSKRDISQAKGDSLSLLRAVRELPVHVVVYIVRIAFVQHPLHWIVGNVFADVVEIFLIADDVLVEVPLPRYLSGRSMHLIYPFCRDGLEGSDQTTQGFWFFVIIHGRGDS